MREETCWLWFQQLFGMGTRRAHLALEHLGHPEKLLDMTRGEIEDDPFFLQRERERILLRDLASADQIVEDSRKISTVLTPDHPDYPELLKQIYSFPLILYVRGDLGVIKEHYAVAMVGSRYPNEYGLMAAHKLSSELASLGAVVVSGLAVGIDAASHKGALDAGGKSVAFLACGMNVNYPSENRDLRIRLEKNGAVVTEFPLGFRGGKGNFIVRNRMISGLSHATVVVQAAKKSGSLITASYAMMQDRDLFAVPGNLFDPKTEGSNQLLLESARPALSARGVLKDLIPVYRYGEPEALAEESAEEAAPIKPVVPDFLSEQQRIIYLALCEGGRTVDELAELTQIEANELLVTLTQLEIFSLARCRPGRLFEALPYLF